MKETLEKLFSNQHLSKAEAKSLFLKILKGTALPAQIASILSCYRMRQITLDELSGFREAAWENCLKIDMSGMETIDVCGTGGDGKNTFNISTISAFVLAACGVKVLKHGGGAVSSKTGSANLLEALGYKFTNDSDQIKKRLDKCGFVFLFAPLFHQSFKHAAPVRKELGVRTVFNLLGPILNPADPAIQVIGVYGLELVKLLTYLGRNLNKNYTIVHSTDGCDEISLTSDVIVSNKHGQKTLAVTDFGLQNISYSDISEGASIEESVQITKNILDNRASKAQLDVVAANSALALQQVYKYRGKEVSLADCLQEIRETIQSGKAAKTLSNILCQS